MLSLLSLGKWLMVVGGLMALTGLLVWIIGQSTGFVRLPGDLVWRKGNVTIYLPLATSLLLSLLVTVIVNLLWRQR